MKQLYFLIICSVFCVVGSTLAQTSNQGTLYVNEATQFSVVNDFQNKEEAEFYNDGESFIYKNFSNNGVVIFTVLQV